MTNEITEAAYQELDAACADLEDEKKRLQARIAKLEFAACEVVDSVDAPHRYSSGVVFVDVGSMAALRRALQDKGDT